jgi:hypothetical protein
MSGGITDRLLYTPNGYPVKLHYINLTKGFNVEWLQDNEESITFTMHRSKDTNEKMLNRIDEKIQDHLRRK